jgi:hypothetical protein
MKTSRIVIAAGFLIYGTAALVPSVYPQFFPHQHAPAWLRYTTAGVLSTPLVALAVLIIVALVKKFAGRTPTSRVVREVPASNGIQVLGTFLDDGGEDR